MRLRYLVFLAFVLAGLTSGRYMQPALAQSGNETANVTAAFKNVVLLVNPEYDDLLKYGTPTLLTILEGQVAGVSAPTRVRFLVPTTAGMNSAGSIDAQGNHSGGPPDRKASSISGWDEISYQLKTNTFRVEYYDPAIIRGQPDKTISYDFRTLFPISDLRVVVQQPRKATNFIVKAIAPGGTAGTDREGFTVYSYYLTNISAGVPVHFDITYTKSDPNPSLGPSGNTNTGAGAGSSALVILVVIGVILIGGIVVWMLKSRQPRYVPVRGGNNQPRRGARSLQKRPSKQGGAANKFCTTCGQPISASDKFCPSCGNEVS